METKAYLSMYSFLMHSADGSAYTKLMDVKSVPAVGGAPEQIDVTTLSHNMFAYINGLQKGEQMQFKCNYNPTDFKKLKEMEKTSAKKAEHFAIYLGGTDGDTPKGDLGQFKFDGQLAVAYDGVDVNKVHEMTIYISPISNIEFSVAE